MSTNEQPISDLPNITRFNNEQLQFVRNGVRVICSVLDEALVLDESFALSETKCLIFAEQVDIRGDLKLAGKHLGISCHSLTIGKPAGVTIDVSGTTLGKPKAVASSDGLPGGSGTSGGSVSVYADTFPANLADLLTVKADGGNGGNGGDTAADGYFPGRGGDGGNGDSGAIRELAMLPTADLFSGSVLFYFPAPAVAVSTFLLEQRTQSWSERLSTIQDADFQASMKSLKDKSKLRKKVYEPFETVVTRYSSFQKACGAARSSLESLLSPFRKDDMLEANQTVKSQMKEVQQRIQNLQKAKVIPTASSLSVADPVPNSGSNTPATAPNPGPSKPVPAMIDLADDTSSASIDSFHSVCDKYLSSTTHSDDDLNGLATAAGGLLNLLPTISAVDLDSERAAIQLCSLKLFEACRLIEADMCSSLAAQVSIRYGERGAGGNGAYANSPKGSNGVDGSPGKVLCGFLSMSSGDKEVLTCAKALAFPEQCQMLLNKANYLAYAGKRADALVYFRRIKTRLSFVAMLGREPVTSTAALRQAFLDLEKDGVTLMSIPRLQSIYRQAVTRTGNLSLDGGADIFGLAADYAPRQPYSTFEKNARDGLGILKELEQMQEAVYSETTTESQLKSHIKDAAKKNTEALNQSMLRQSALEDDNGPIAKNIYQMVSYQSQFSSKKWLVLEALRKIEKDISNKFTLTPSMVLDALGTVAFAPHETLLKAVSLAKIVYEGLSEVESSDGRLVNKDYVISQISDAGDTLEKLVEAFQTRSDYSISIDDPSAIKLLAAKDKINTILDNFKSSINPKNNEEFADAFEDYMNVVYGRNGCIVEYNAALQLLIEAKAQVKLCTAEKEHLSAEKLQLDPTLPAFGLFVNNMLETVKLDVMKNINLASRALAYWGPCPLLELSDTDVAPNPDSVTLAAVLNTKLTAVKTKIVDSYATHAISKWPTAKSADTAIPTKSQIYELTTGDITSLKQVRTKVDLKGAKTSFHQISPVLRPGMNNAYTPGETFLAGRGNVRINQIFLWLPGIRRTPNQYGNQWITVDILMGGKETIYDYANKPYTFTHETVGASWEFFAENIKTLADCTLDKRAADQVIDSTWVGDAQQKDADIKAMGPWCMWTFTISADKNPGLDLSGVTNGYLELHGWSQST